MSAALPSAYVRERAMLMDLVRKKRIENATLHKILTVLVDRFEHVCKDIDGNIDPIDARLMRRVRKALSESGGD